MGLKPASVFKSTILMMVMIALTAVGFAHRFGGSVPSSALADYLAIGGSLADLCGGDGVPTERGSKCEACRISDTANAPEMPCLLPVSLTLTTQAQFVVAKRLHEARDLDPARLTRAPPQA